MAHESDYGDKSGQDSVKMKKMKKRPMTRKPMMKKKGMKKIPTTMSSGTSHTGGY